MVTQGQVRTSWDTASMGEDPVYIDSEHALTIDCTTCGVPFFGAQKGTHDARAMLKAIKQHEDATHGQYDKSSIIKPTQAAVVQFNTGHSEPVRVGRYRLRLFVVVDQLAEKAHALQNALEAFSREWLAASEADQLPIDVESRIVGDSLARLFGELAKVANPPTDVVHNSGGWFVRQLQAAGEAYAPSVGDALGKATVYGPLLVLAQEIVRLTSRLI